MADPDRQMRGRGVVSHLDPEIRGGGGDPKKDFSAPRASAWSKNKGGGSGPPGPSPGWALRSVLIFLKVTTALVFFSRLIFISARIELLKCLSI